MIVGIGTDLTGIERIRQACRRESFAKAVYTERERDYAGGKAEHLAAMFAAKEATAKALGSGFAGFRPDDIEVLHTAEGQPYIELWRGAAERLRVIGGTSCHLSLSHEGEFAIAFVIIEGGERSCSD